MASSLRVAIAVSIIVCLCAGVNSSATAASRSVTEIRFRTESDRTRIVLDLSGELRYSVRTAAGPFRIVVDLPNCRFAGGVGNIDVHDGLLDRIRVNRLKTGAQVVLDLPRRAEFAHFPLKPDSGKPHRIVIDIARSEAGGAGGAAKEVVGEGGAVKEAAAVANPEKKPRTALRASGGDRVVIIDPGHGGKHTGTISRSGIQEKTLTLKLAKMLRTEIEKRPGYRAMLVRESDRHFDEDRARDLVKRIEFARERGGDVYVSLHFNGNDNKKVHGLELYFLSLEASDENAGAVAERENLLVMAGADSAGFNDDLKSILFDVSLANAIQQSSALAEEAASVLRVDPPIPFRKVKQAPFLVLRGISMPSILVEGGYLSNRKEAAIVSKESYLRWLAKSLAEGIVSFLEKHPYQADSAAGE
ncbi:MAG: N-acetylmuramoyl-L-alanine amidase [Candidatus Krumholzibacteriia bacterium]